MSGGALVDVERVKSMVDELCDLESGLTDWEVDFVDALARREPFQVSPREAEKVEQIYGQRR